MTVKPVVTLDLDKTPEPSDVSDEDNTPTGDIALLTQQVQSNATASQPVDSQSSARLRIFTTKKGKNKGVGKGQSGSSGPPVKKKATATVSRPPASPSSSEAEESSSDDEVAAVQQIMVKSKPGYTHYPAYLFDNPPKKLKTDTLWKKLMISEIKRSETQTEFYERGMVLMGHLKEFMRQILMSGGLPVPSTSQKNGEHAYAMDVNSEDENQPNGDSACKDQ